MKTTINIAAKRAILILTLFSGIQISTLMAKSPGYSGPAKNNLDLPSLAPATPKEATFQDNIPEEKSYVNLAPFTPKEATFEDDNNNNTGTGITSDFLREVAPITPDFADFEDAAPDLVNDTVAVHFRTPQNADFTDF